MKKLHLLKKITKWRLKGNNNYYIFIFASIIVGVLTGLGAVVLKNIVHLIQNFLLPFGDKNNGISFFIFPLAGLILTYIYIKISKLDIRAGVPNLLYSISGNSGYMKPHNLFSSIIGSVLTVGFGASGGLESPNMTTGGGLASSVSRILKLTYKQRMLLLGVASAGTISAIFKAPVTGIIFALEVIMIDLTSMTIIPIVLASITASLTSYLFLGSNFIYSLDVITIFKAKEIPYYILMGVLTGFFALFFTSLYKKLKSKFNKVKKSFVRFLTAGLIVGTFVFIFPATYAEGYTGLTAALEGDYSYLFNNFLLEPFNSNGKFIFLIFLLIAVVKAISTSVTVSAGGIGGFFTPILFVGVNLGLFMSHLFDKLGIHISHESSALVAMAGLISAMMHAPLSSVFFIGELTGGYSLMMPLLITSSIAYVTIRIFQKHNFFSEELAEKKILLTHHADQNILTILKLKDLVETNFVTVNSNSTLKDVVYAVKNGTRDLFPVVDEHNTFLGVISLNGIRKIMFKTELYDKTSVTELMIFPSVYVELNEHLSDVAEKFEKTRRYNLLVLDNGKYVGFLSRSNFFLHYRTLLAQFSDH